MPGIILHFQNSLRIFLRNGERGAFPAVARIDGVAGEQRAERKEQPRPEYAAPSAEKEEEEEVFEREEAETDNGLMVLTT